MIKNYFTIPYRGMLKNKSQTAINIAGLAIGLTCSLLIMIWVQNELTTDGWHGHNDRLFEVYERQYSNSIVDGSYGTPGLLANELKITIPEVEYATSVDYDKWHTFQLDDKILTLNGGYAGEDYFKMFGNKLLAGHAQSALSSLSGIAISHKMANQFFGSPQAAMDKSLRYDNKMNFIVKAVFEDLPINTSKKFEYLLTSNEELNEHPWLKGWDTQGPETDILLRKDANLKIVEEKIAHLLDKFNKDQKYLKTDLGIQLFSEVYLHGNFENGTPNSGRIEYVRIFILIAVFILLIACINFMNLTTARSVKRALEIGVRKVLGATRSVLIKQFIGESMLITTVGVVISLGLVAILLPYFNEITQKQLELPFSSLSFWIKLLIITIVTGFISGSYPALFLSSFEPIKVLNGVTKLGIKATIFRKSLVVFQFVLSIILIIGTLIIARQVNYIQAKNLGYARENLIFLPLTGDLKNKYSLFETEVINMPGIQSVTHSSEAPTDIENAESDVQWIGKDPYDKAQFTIMGAGYDFVNTMKLTLLQGRDYSRDFQTDFTGFLINESAQKKLGYTQPIGQPLTLWGKKGKIIGLLKDFHYTSLHDPIKPLIVHFGEYDSMGTALIRTRPGMTKEALVSLESVCKKLNSNFPFNYSFSDDEYKSLYQNEQMIGQLSTAFALLAIFISCLGLLGQVMFIAEQRIKEIGIRKLLGASISSLFNLLSREFLSLVVISLLIASPISYFALQAWLGSFAYHTTIPWWTFGLAAVIALFITFLTISVQALKAALTNPVKSLRT